MPDNLTPEDRRKTMRAVKGKNTSLERRLSGMLAGMRLNGWKKNVADLPGKPDVLFPDERVAIFVDGCFWHGCPHCKRKLPETNRSYWARKIQRNVERDQRSTRMLSGAGWRVIRLWEHDLSSHAERERIRRDILSALTGETAK